MKRLPCCVVAILLLGNAAWGQSPPSYEELQKKLDSTVELLKNAQDRKNELGIENQRLQKRIVELEHQLSHAPVPSNSEGNQRIHDPIWRAFLQANPAVNQMWTLFIQASESSDPVSKLLGFDNWPFGIDG